MSSSNCCFLTSIQISLEAGHMVSYSYLLKNFPVCCDPNSQRLWRSQLSKSTCFSGTRLLFWWSNGCWQSDLFLKSSLNICKFTVHILLKPGLENFEHYVASEWDECNCMVVWTFFGTAFLWDWSENWPFHSWGDRYPRLWQVLSGMRGWPTLGLPWRTTGPDSQVSAIRKFWNS